MVNPRREQNQCEEAKMKYFIFDFLVKNISEKDVYKYKDCINENEALNPGMIMCESEHTNEEGYCDETSMKQVLEYWESQRADSEECPKYTCPINQKINQCGPTYLNRMCNDSTRRFCAKDGYCTDTLSSYDYQGDDRDPEYVITILKDEKSWNLNHELHKNLDENIEELEKKVEENKAKDEDEKLQTDWSPNEVISINGKWDYSELPTECCKKWYSEHLPRIQFKENVQELLSAREERKKKFLERATKYDFINDILEKYHPYRQLRRTFACRNTILQGWTVSDDDCDNNCLSVKELSDNYKNIPDTKEACKKMTAEWQVLKDADKKYFNKLSEEKRKRYTDEKFEIYQTKNPELTLPEHSYDASVLVFLYKQSMLPGQVSKTVEKWPHQDCEAKKKNGDNVKWNHETKKCEEVLSAKERRKQNRRQKKEAKNSKKKAKKSKKKAIRRMSPSHIDDSENLLSENVEEAMQDVRFLEEKKEPDTKEQGSFPTKRQLHPSEIDDTGNLLSENIGEAMQDVRLLVEKENDERLRQTAEETRRQLMAVEEALDSVEDKLNV